MYFRVIVCSLLMLSIVEALQLQTLLLCTGCVTLTTLNGVKKSCGDLILSYNITGSQCQQISGWFDQRNYFSSFRVIADASNQVAYTFYTTSTCNNNSVLTRSPSFSANTCGEGFFLQINSKYYGVSFVVASPDPTVDPPTNTSPTNPNPSPTNPQSPAACEDTCQSQFVSCMGNSLNQTTCLKSFLPCVWGCNGDTLNQQQQQCLTDNCSSQCSTDKNACLSCANSKCQIKIGNTATGVSTTISIMTTAVFGVIVGMLELLQ